MLLGDADKLCLGQAKVDKVYLGSAEAWKPSGFDPISLGGLTVWLDASQLALADGATVNTWPSLVSPFLVGTNFAAAPNRPVMRANAQNGLAVVRFSPGGGLRWPDNGLDLQWTVICVVRMWGAAVGRVVSGAYPPSNIAFGYHGGSEDKFYVEGWLTPDMSHAQTTNWKLYTGWGDGGPGNAATGVYSNGAYLTGGQPNTQNGGGWKGTFQLNGYSPTSSEETCQCEVAEVLIYNRRLSDADRIQVEDYLRTKWGL